MTNKMVDIVEIPEIHEIRFYIPINTKNLTKVCSSEVILGSLPWKIKIEKRSTVDGDVIDLFLICSPQLGLEKCDWSCEAGATITLRSVESQQTLYRKCLPKKQFNNSQLCEPLNEFIKCADSLKYEQNGRLIFDVHLRADPIKYAVKSNIEQTRVTFRFIVDEVSKLGKKYSPEVILRGTKFSVMVEKREENGNKYLEVYLCDKRDSKNQNWTWGANVSFKLLSLDENVEPIVQNYQKNFYYDVPNWGLRKFAAWELFIDPLKKYVQNDKAIIEIDLEVGSAKPILCSDQTPPKPFECSICLQSVIGREPTATKCGHLFCGSCIRRTIEDRQTCPLCNSHAVSTELKPIYV